MPNSTGPTGPTGNPEVHVITGGPTVPSNSIHNPGQALLPASAGVAAAITKGAAGSVKSVHGTVAGIIFDSETK
jgi:hypothetical protein